MQDGFFLNTLLINVSITKLKHVFSVIFRFSVLIRSLNLNFRILESCLRFGSCEKVRSKPNKRNKYDIYFYLKS